MNKWFLIGMGEGLIISVGSVFVVAGIAGMVQGEVCRGAWVVALGAVILAAAVVWIRKIQPR
jgi:hypothetical protein